MQKNPSTATVRTPAANFTGQVWMNPVFTGDGVSELTVALVRFTPGARTNWHSHTNGQLLVCTDGIGLVGTRDGNTVLLHPGESVWTPAGEEHFHGATTDNMMCHYAILDASGDAEATTWLEPVTDEQYVAAAGAASSGTWRPAPGGR
jgi:quercetin dioxygenase-like cupin family protein